MPSAGLNRRRGDRRDLRLRENCWPSPQPAKQLILGENRNRRVFLFDGEAFCADDDDCSSDGNVATDRSGEQFAGTVRLEYGVVDVPLFLPATINVLVAAQTDWPVWFFVFNVKTPPCPMTT